MHFIDVIKVTCVTSYL